MASRWLYKYKKTGAFFWYLRFGNSWVRIAGAHLCWYVTHEGVIFKNFAIKHFKKLIYWCIGNVGVTHNLKLDLKTQNENANWLSQMYLDSQSGVFLCRKTLQNDTNGGYKCFKFCRRRAYVLYYTIIILWGRCMKGTGETSFQLVHP